MDRLISKSTTKVIQVAVGIITNSEGELLVAKRPEHWLGGGFWEFPGGKLEANEDSITALKRELREEVGIIADKCSPLIRLTYAYPERTVILHAWNVESFSGDATGLEGQEISWRPPRDLNQLNMLPANRAIVVATLLPNEYLITPCYRDSTIFWQELEKKLLSNSIRMIKFQSNNLDDESYLSAAKKIISHCHKSKVSVLASHQNFDVLDQIDADGIIITSEQLERIEKRPLSKEKWVGVSCQSLKQILHAEESGVDFLEIESTLDAKERSQLITCANLPIYEVEKKVGADFALVKRVLWNGICK